MFLDLSKVSYAATGGGPPPKEGEIPPWGKLDSDDENLPDSEEVDS